MFIDLPMNDGIVRLENLDHIAYGEITDDSEIEISNSFRDSFTDKYYIVIHMKKGCHCDSYEYTFPDFSKYEEVLTPLLNGLSLKQFGDK